MKEILKVIVGMLTLGIGVVVLWFLSIYPIIAFWILMAVIAYLIGNLIFTIKGE